LWTQ